jgi:hypothetical protein
VTELSEARSRAAVPLHDRRWLHWGAIVLAADVVVHNTAGVLSNDWEGWGVVAVTFVFVLVTGLIITGITYGLVARWALHRRHAAGAALGTGLVSLASYAIVFTWAPVLIAPAAFLLTREALREEPTPRARRMALTGGAFTVATVAVFVWFFVQAAVTGSLPNLPFLGPLNPAL